MLTPSRIGASILLFLLAATLHAAEVKGVVVDPSGSPVTGAQVAAVNGAGVIVSQITDDNGGYDFNVSPLYEYVQLRVSAPGFQTVTVGEGVGHVVLQLSPQMDSRITSGDLRDRNEAQVVDLMREMPGMVIAQSGARGSMASLYVRGSDANDNLVLLNGIPLNSFAYGGLFDFSQVPADVIEDVQVARGPQSPVYGSYAVGSVVNFATRSPDNGPALDLVAEGGSHDENRFAIGGSGLAHGWGIAGSLSSLRDDADSSYRNDNVFLSGEHRWYTQSLFVFGDFNSNHFDDPKVVNFKNDASTYGLHYQDDFTQNVRLDVTSGFYLDNSTYDKDIRLYGDARSTWHVLKFWTLEAGYSFSREETRATDVSLFRRDDQGIYIDNQFVFGRNLFLNAGGREEIYQNSTQTVTRFDPRVSGAYVLAKDLRLHASYGTGMRPPGESELIFNPGLRPERTESYDIGVQETFLANRISVNGTWFHNRYKDLIPPLLIGSTSAILVGELSATPPSNILLFGNVGNAKAEGAEFSARVRTASWFSITGNYTWLESAVLSPAPLYFYVGEPLLRRPKQSGSAVGSVHYGKFDVNAVGYVRGWDLDYFQRLGGYLNVGLNVNYRVRGNLTAYVNLRNALDRRYEEVAGFPTPLLNFVVGMKWSLAHAR